MMLIGVVILIVLFTIDVVAVYKRHHEGVNA